MRKDELSIKYKANFNVRKGTKYQRMIDTYDGALCPSIISAIIDHIPQELKESLTGRELGLVMQAVNNAYHAGIASAGAEIIDEDSIWIHEFQALISLDDIRKLIEKEA